MPVGRSALRAIAKATRETPRRSETPSLNVVNSAPAMTMATPKPLPTADIVLCRGDDDAETPDGPSTVRAVSATPR